MKIILSERLKELREENGMTQKQIAAKLGISSVAYLRYEKSQREPSLSMLAEIAKIFNVSTDYLLGVSDF